MEFPRETQCARFLLESVFTCENVSSQWIVVNGRKFYLKHYVPSLFIDFLAGKAINTRTYFEDDMKNTPEWVSFKLILKDGWVTVLRI